jgi:hypothetical protein
MQPTGHRDRGGVHEFARRVADYIAEDLGWLDDEQ